MKLSDFIVLNEEEKKLAVLHEGVLIAKRNYFDYMVFHFQLDSYYVETYCSITNMTIEEYRIFENTKPLSPYLEAIQIDDLLN